MKDKVALVTGGSRGIGRAIVLALARAGAKVAFTYNTSEKEAKELEKSTGQWFDKLTIPRIIPSEVEGPVNRSTGPDSTGRLESGRLADRQTKAYKCDVKNFDEAKQLIEQVKTDFGGLDFLINNAGIIKDKALMVMERSDWDEVIDTNLGGVFNMCRAAVVTFMKQKSGVIVNISSVAGVTGMPRQTNYSASKAGIIGFSKALAKEVAAYGIRVNVVAPGFIETDMTAGLKNKEELVKRIPLARFGKAEEVAKTVLFLLSERANYITGQVVRVDGGMTMQY